MSDESIPLSKKGQRKMSSFVGQELLYDYVTEQLDGQRKVAIEDLLKNSAEAQGGAQAIRNGIQYVNHLQQTRIADSLVEKVKMPSSYLQEILQKIKLDRWPVGLRLGLEAALVAVGIVLVAMIVPWNRILQLRSNANKGIILTEVTRESDRSKSVAQIKPEEPAFPDEASAGLTPPQEATLAPPAARVAATPVKPTKMGEGVAVGVAKPTESSEGKRQGFLYRGTVIVTNIVAVTPKFVEKITELGGRKAGQVALGWKQGSGSYFHFTIPESKYQSLVDFMNQYGKLSIQKEKHDRVMPDGIVRLIVIVDEKKN